jgi:hypothetical protein
MAELVYYDNTGKEVYRLDSSGIRMNKDYNQSAIITKNSFVYYSQLIPGEGFKKNNAGTVIYY